MAGNLKNRADQGEMRDIVERIEKLNGEKESERGTYMQRCAKINERIDQVLEEAKDKGLPKKVVKAVLKARDLERRADAQFDALEADDAELFHDIREALGDFADSPLGAAAVQREESGQDETTAAIVGAIEADEEREKIDAQKAEDAEAFGDDSKVTSIDPKAARANRAKKTANA
ncbi:DUF2312 domain-containing protein [Aurantimonas sp. DM33-3]|uniref:DUF2312 domain-containing protein n=1 Tax=Aurantimonas sp. DM33-3 TaxID=2766955 RepID=UPI001652AE90|nr:DUF2312 domain-containing protein [Aurantimonas sp. DM33-3]MBC6714740.1 DUF2312 domain-containing protein [Aurantimonas sp. DM33-3]